ncbi:MAG: site-specific DNA-methyltransferase [Oscillospiraceae bacterium]|nr:site-specific DNA-methyltransferase [Oscillospiraceae bacterium]
MESENTAPEAFGLGFVGRRAAMAEVSAPNRCRLIPADASEKNVGNSQNLYIEGDCLDALRCLRETHSGRIRMIYIDPPYNTGSDHVYNDRFRQTISAYRGLGAAADEYGQQHSAWCAMMYPRLAIARELLTEDGVIFISIGEQELHTLLFLCDELYGAENRITLFSRVTKKSSNNGGQFSPCVDYIAAYARCAVKVPPYTVALPEEIVSRYKKHDAHLAQRGPYQEVSLYMSALKHGGSCYPIVCPDGQEVIPPNGKPWRWNPERLAKGLAEDRVVFKKSTRSPLLDARTGVRAHWNVYTKMYLGERGEGLHPKNFSEAFPNTLASHELRRLGIPFDFAKPVSLIAYLVKLQTAEDSIVLDLFSGSATTAHAVMQLNAEDGGCRRFIMVQIPEAVAPNGTAAAQGFQTICDIGKERIRRAAKQLHAIHPDAEFDDGFRVMRIMPDGGED